VLHGLHDPAQEERHGYRGCQRHESDAGDQNANAVGSGTVAQGRRANDA
jgi:hypothetical protein